ncbi:hypothetical protein [Rhodococcus tibetensis]|uniref:SMP-30/Gluconolactonase/LRE-like region domain-containing protein n=1 Tax=Rhodococcus tibetensis TaxID=2965064 RepID=A0ABT1QAK4_9NOCA|nr:hypothetical protein [Rhodococcus sp. FXJ9.536]MCQ4119299.1 hypothetical protein [Rhodococcus sp. FXJ9.536]
MRRELTALAGGSVLCAGLLAAAPAAAGPAFAPPVGTCTPWAVSEVVSGAGVVENLAFDGAGTMLVSRTGLVGGGGVDGVDPDGTIREIVPDVDAPGGIAVHGSDVYFATGNSFSSGVAGTESGTIDVVNLETGDTRTVAQGLVMPNGLVRLDNGDILTARNLGAGAGLTRVPAAEPHTPETVRTDLGTVDGLAAHDGNIYTVTTFDTTTTLRILRVDDLTGPIVSIPLPGAGPLNAADDLTVGPDGIVYVAYNGGGKVVRVDPATGDSCAIASGVPLVSSVRFGAGPGWNAEALYATSFTGTIYRLERP